MLLLVLNLGGTFAFGLSGGMAGVRARLDLFGVVVLAVVVGLAGGITRASLGVQSFDPIVQRAINRVQTFEQTAAYAASFVLAAAAVLALIVVTLLRPGHTAAPTTRASAEVATPLTTEKDPA